ncbi:hypothetical protein AAVH_24920 [Aphelenchoides avenae]|nr:hypothetical protein AAVH_24920 [Aphelenchus avenae]
MSEKRDLFDLLKEYAETRTDIERIYREIEHFMEERREIQSSSALAMERIGQMDQMKKEMVLNPATSKEAMNKRARVLHQLQKEADQALQNADVRMHELEAEIVDAERRLSAANDRMEKTVDEMRLYTFA